MASAGHLPPVHVRPGGEARFADVEPSPPLGAPGSPARGYQLTIEKGDLLFLYTDGLIEQRSVALKERLDQLLAVLREPADGPLDELCERVLGRLAPFGDGGFGGSASDRRRQDDVAILGLKRLRPLNLPV
jgi:serine phosphatase RsbU (regulator of sigma subunit)